MREGHLSARRNPEYPASYGDGGDWATTAPGHNALERPIAAVRRYLWLIVIAADPFGHRNC